MCSKNGGGRLANFGAVYTRRGHGEGQLAALRAGVGGNGECVYKDFGALWPD
jgi:hypothetical protein